MPAGIVIDVEKIVKQNSKINTANTAQESLSLDDFWDGIKFISDYILSQKKEKNNSKIEIKYYFKRKKTCRFRTVRRRDRY